jgi:hypothetical protein
VLKNSTGTFWVEYDGLDTNTVVLYTHRKILDPKNLPKSVLFDILYVPLTLHKYVFYTIKGG